MLRQSGAPPGPVALDRFVSLSRRQARGGGVRRELGFGSTAPARPVRLTAPRQVAAGKHRCARRSRSESQIPEAAEPSGVRRG